MDEQPAPPASTETTGLHDEARIVEVSAMTARGDVLLDTHGDPGWPAHTHRLAGGSGARDRRRSPLGGQ
ncbi:hypothetical protein ACWDA7_47840 [Streptomyces sp. NPDC001156]